MNSFVIVTGMSGAGKSSVLKFLEDIGYFCVDNLPPALMPKFSEICKRNTSDMNKVALGLDIRGGDLFTDLFSALETLVKMNQSYTILFLDASDDVLIKRYKETRRTHPLALNDPITTGIAKERAILRDARAHASYIIDTSSLLTRQLKTQISDIFLENKQFSNLMITISSFGFKYGIPADADLVFDVRFIPNPFYVPELKPQTGNDKPVQDYVMRWDVSRVFFDKLKDMLIFLLPHYIAEGKNQLAIAIGCTGGKHRSVTLANALFKALENAGQSVVISHRDIDNDAKRA